MILPTTPLNADELAAFYSAARAMERALLYYILDNPEVSVIGHLAEISERTKLFQAEIESIKHGVYIRASKEEAQK